MHAQNAADHLNAEIRILRPAHRNQCEGAWRIETQRYGYLEDQYFLLFVDGHGQQIVVRIVRRVPGDFRIRNAQCRQPRARLVHCRIAVAHLHQH